jgi:hypothetical protein
MSEPARSAPLWASPGTKNPDYSDILYVSELIGHAGRRATVTGRIRAAFVQERRTRQRSASRAYVAVRTRQRRTRDEDMDVLKDGPELSREGAGRPPDPGFRPVARPSGRR